MLRFNNYSSQLYNINITLVYSTMDEYLSEIKKYDYEYPIYRGDFFPEIEDPVYDIGGRNTSEIEYWTGYYSSKPNYKQ